MEPFTSAAADLDKVVERLGFELADNPIQVQTLATLRLVLNDKMDELQSTIQLKKAERSDEALKAVVSNRGKAIMDRARDVISRMLVEEQRLLTVRQVTAERTANWIVGGIAGAIIVTIALGWLVVADAKRQFSAVNKAENSARTAHTRTLEEITRRERLESQLRQSQKMEAIGQLTGGIAHDFNNMLAVVIGSLNLLKRRLQRGETDNMRFVDGALDGAERAATLTHRLLAFSRLQLLAPQSLGANKLISGMSEMLRRTLGDHIMVETVLAGGFGERMPMLASLRARFLILPLTVATPCPMAESSPLSPLTPVSMKLTPLSISKSRPGSMCFWRLPTQGKVCPPTLLPKPSILSSRRKTWAKGRVLASARSWALLSSRGGHVKIYSENPASTTEAVFYA